jgi:hypothetical protein
VVSGVDGDVGVLQKIMADVMTGASEMLAGQVLLHGIIVLFVSFIVMFLGWILQRIMLKRETGATVPAESWSDIPQSQSVADAAPPSYPPPPQIPPMTQDGPHEEKAEKQNHGEGQAE